MLDKATLLLLALKEYNLNIEGVSHSETQKRMESWTSVIAALSTDPPLLRTFITLHLKWV